ncbi:hypothetical protein AB434_2147 [Heyndrickxia coagulans]|uniref:Uncharacterized protein n=1 Tax=Heyndrickxia coagulans TaxID=1398 RepID=A0AAN0WCZ4_HEYCO|nr:hypothetical protein SB48_HM08orf05080 [Heyndrickxia coagulans]AKN54552.1 hypothetical protein AB434_2147 [Heyndrickxia coagulans]
MPAARPLRFSVCHPGFSPAYLAIFFIPKPMRRLIFILLPTLRSLRHGV